MPRAKLHVFKSLAIITQCDFALGASIKISEDSSRETALGRAAQIADVDDAWRPEGARHWL
jgi:hypothetical protein